MRSFALLLYEADGEKRRWTVVFKPIPREWRYGKKRTVYGRCQFDKQIITVNSRLRDPQVIADTIAHEAMHVALGPGASEVAIESSEWNWVAIRKRMEKQNG
jgi:hypothetical protein